MLQNYLKIALRNLMRHKGYSLINVLGLSVGVACCVLIGLFIHDEFRVDRFHKKSDRIYKLLREMRNDDGIRDMGFGTSGAAGPALKKDYSEIETVVRYMLDYSWTTYKDRKFNQRFCLTDPDFLDVFDFELVIGDRATVLKEPLSILVTETAARRFFGDDDPIGKVLTVDDRYMGGVYTITGVLKNAPRQSTMQFDIVCATVNTLWTRNVFENWAVDSTWRPAHNYILLREGADVKALEAKLPKFMARYMGDEIVKKSTYFLQPFERIYLYSKVDYGISSHSDITYVYLFAIIGLFILLIACINFMNLSTARSARRAREVGLRKVVGAYRAQLIRQFLGETFLTALLAGILSLIIVKFSLPLLNNFAQKTIALEGQTLWYAIAGLFVLTVLVSVLAGGYPALFLSSFRPVMVLKGTLVSGARSGRLATDSRGIPICDLDIFNCGYIHGVSAVELCAK